MTAAGSPSSMRNTRLIISMMGWKAMARPNESACPSTHTAVAPSWPRSSCTSRDLPTPPSPQPCLPAPGLAHEHHALPAAGVGALEPIGQEPQLFLPSDEARAAGLRRPPHLIRREASRPPPL